MLVSIRPVYGIVMTQIFGTISGRLAVIDFADIDLLKLYDLILSIRYTFHLDYIYV